MAKCCGTCEWWEREESLGGRACKFYVHHQDLWAKQPEIYANSEMRATDDDYGQNCPTYKAREVQPQDCPWCGNSDARDYVVMSGLNGYHQVICMGSCQAHGPKKEGKGESVAAWNRIRLEDT